MKNSISAYMIGKASEHFGGTVDIDSILFSEAVAPVSLGGLLGSTGARSRDHYECLIIPVSSW
jgi:hypothetical protein